MKKNDIRSINYLAAEEIVNRYWISISDLMILIPQLTYEAARKEFFKMKKEMELNNEFYFRSKPVLLPIKKFIDKYNIDVNLIRKEANKIKKYKRGECYLNGENQMEKYN